MGRGWLAKTGSTYEFKPSVMGVQWEELSWRERYELCCMVSSYIPRE